MSTAPKYIPNYTVTDYMQWEGDWELWQGIPIAMTPSPSGFHQRTSLRLARTLLSAIENHGCHADVLQEIDWVISENTVVRPDVVVVCGDTPEGHIHEPPTLIAEIVSPSTRKRDQTEKLSLYERNGVGTYLILDPVEKTVCAFQRRDDRLAEAEVRNTLALSLCEDCEIEIEVADAF